MSFKRAFRAPPITPGLSYIKIAKRKRRKRAWVTAAIFGGTAFGVFGLGMVATNWLSIAATAAATVTAQFDVRAGERTTCVIDGDTFWLEGEEIRIADIDTPEVTEPKCPAERDLGLQATYRLRDLLNDGGFALVKACGRDRDLYGRHLRLVVRNGESIGDRLVSEGLAHHWRGRKEPWC